MVPKGSTLLKVTSILLVILSIITILAALVVIFGGAGVGLVGGAGFVDGAGAGAGLLAAGGIAISILGSLYLVSGVFQLIAGILGIKRSKYAQPATACLVMGIIILACQLIGVLCSWNWSAAASMVIPLLYTIGAVQNNRSW